MRRAVRTALTAAGVAIGVAPDRRAALDRCRRTPDRRRPDPRRALGLRRLPAGRVRPDQSLLPESLDAKLAGDTRDHNVAAIFLRVSRVENRDAFLVFGLRPGEFAEPALRDRGRAARAGERGDASGTTAARSLHARAGRPAPRREEAYRIAGLYHSGNHFEDIGAALPLAAVQKLARGRAR